MKQSKRILHIQLLILLGVIIFLPALLINLGLFPLIEDESIRALVALEMMISHDYWTPTLGGELYFKKPPLYNWILTVFFKLFGVNDFVFRLPVVITLIAFCLIIYFVAKKELNSKTGLFSALFFLTNGRVLFYESLHGLIDILFSLIIFINFYIIYRYFKRENYWYLFFFSYFLIAIAFLLKGLPSLVFQAFTLISLFVWKKQFKNLFHLSHFIGIVSFLFIVGSYYAIYFSKNEGTFIELFTTLFTESTRRTPIRFGFLATITHFISFPVEIVYHFLPWSLLLVFLGFKKSFQLIKQNDFVQYLLLLILSNILVYWISPEFHPRYILMLIALLFIILAYIYVEFEQINHPVIKFLNTIFSILIAILFISPFVGFFINEIRFINNVQLKIIHLIFINILLVWLFLKNRNRAIIYLILFIGVFRIGFDLFVLPHRNLYSKAAIERDQAINIANVVNKDSVNAYWPEWKQASNYYGTRVMQYAPMYYLTKEKNQILKSVSTLRQGAYYLAYPSELEHYDYQIIDEIDLKSGNEIALIKLIAK